MRFEIEATVHEKNIEEAIATVISDSFKNSVTSSVRATVPLAIVGEFSVRGNIENN